MFLSYSLNVSFFLLSYCPSFQKPRVLYPFPQNFCSVMSKIYGDLKTKQFDDVMNNLEGTKLFLNTLFIKNKICQLRQFH